jgi:hypothetical protein
MNYSYFIFSKVIGTFFGGLVLLSGWSIGLSGINLIPNSLSEGFSKNDTKLSIASPCPNNWERISMPTNHTIISADFITSDDGWAVGFDGIFHWQNGKWTFYSNPSDVRLNSVKMISSSEGWIVGSGGSIYRWNGQDWQKFPSPTKDNLYSLYFLSPNQGWAAGGVYVPDATANGSLSERVTLEWNGKNWSIKSLSGLNPSYGELNSIAMISPESGWAAGDGDILRLNSQKWQNYHLSDDQEAEYSFQSIAILNSENAWMAGYSYINKYGELFHWDGSKWSEEKKVQYSLNSISMPDLDFGLAGGGSNFSTRNMSILLCWDGQQWSEIKNPSIYPIHFVWAKSSKEIWIFSGDYYMSSTGLGEVFKVDNLQTPTENPTATTTSSIPPIFTPTLTVQPAITKVNTLEIVSSTPAINQPEKGQTTSFDPYLFGFGFFVVLVFVSYLFFRFNRRK